MDISEKHALYTKSSWNSLKEEEPRLEVFLRRVEEEMFTVIERPVKHSNLSQEEWKEKDLWQMTEMYPLKKWMKSSVFSYGIVMIV